MTRTISITELRESGVDTWSVKDDGPRGIATKYTSQIKPGDKVVIDNYFITVTEEPAQEAAETIQSEADPVSCIRAAIEAEPARSAFGRGVKVYALELLDDLDPSALAHPETIQRVLLNGASDWSKYSYGGSALIYDSDIAERLCSPSELKRSRNGERNPNSRETWLDVQARALAQAARIITRAARA